MVAHAFYTSVWDAFNDVNVFLSSHALAVHVALVPIGLLISFFGTEVVPSLALFATMSAAGIALYAAFVVTLPPLISAALSLGLSLALCGVIASAGEVALFVGGALATTYVAAPYVSSDMAEVGCAALGGALVVWGGPFIIALVSAFAGAFAAVTGFAFLVESYSSLRTANWLSLDNWTVSDILFVIAFLGIGALGFLRQRRALWMNRRAESYTPLPQ